MFGSLSHNDIIQGGCAFVGGYFGQNYFYSLPVGCALGGIAGRVFLDMKGPKHKISPFDDSDYIIKIGIITFLCAAGSELVLPGNDLLGALAGGLGAAMTHRMTYTQ